MPILTELSDESDWVEPDDVPRPVVTYGFMAEDFGGLELDLHRHAKGQIVLVQRGALSCEVDGGLWIVPPRSAVWIPGGALHAIKVSGTLDGYGAFIDTAWSAGLPTSCCAISVTPLLRELLARAANLPLLYAENGVNTRLISVLLDELGSAEIEDLHLPMPSDPRLRRIVEEMMAAPADRGTIDAWAGRAGLSERTLARLIRRETGMSFGRWRQQLGIMLAVKWLAAGGSIKQVAGDLGYESVPSFVTMFRKALGTSPGRYMAERHAGRH
ncbi:AraC family transcriptional regulator [Sphingomonas psychrotolerans]|uniref:AraC family transcriptional regulator n=1 Tax=Sphingomonas psychrotolerans TaxID=1327635 RepID=A0A2K8MHV8_9SPHN|nr:helix-turn-helix transcriptional regulator [Sphingomonas psychrotolerans]ATY33472.1 AraC family transcriptional regulator [Sphingomonas psychrotolerans]